jgi:hypothetical protein
LHFNVTEHPTSAWVAQQMTEAFGDGLGPRYLIGDRDGVYGNEVRERLNSLDIEEVLTAPQSRRQNGYAEQQILSIRRKCLNHWIFRITGQRAAYESHAFRNRETRPVSAVLVAQ